MTSLISLIVCFLFSCVLPVGETYMTRIDQCEPIEIPRCRAMPYNMTQMPNLMHHNTQENARLVFERFEVLLDQNCSQELLFLLCSIYVPICAVSLQPEAIPPCRSVCEKARAGCEPLMNSYNVSWPESLDCARLPRYERGVCVSPEAFVKPTKPKKAGCTRCKKKRLSWSNMKKHDYDYAIKVQVVRGKRVSGTETVYRVRLARVIFSGRAVKFPAAGGDVSVWVNSTCACPKLHKGRDYLIAGHAAGGAISKLVISPVTMVTAWKDAHLVQINKWSSKSVPKNEKSKFKKPKIKTEKNKKRKNGATQHAPMKSTKGKQSDMKPSNGKATNVKQSLAVSQGDNVKTTESSSTSSNSSDFMNGYTHGGRYYTKELAKKYNQATLRAARS